MTGLTQRQTEVFAFVSCELETKGVAPSLTEIGASARLKSKSTVSRYLGILERRGYIRREPRRARAIEVLRTITPRDTIYDHFMRIVRGYRTAPPAQLLNVPLDNIRIPSSHKKDAQ